MALHNSELFRRIEEYFTPISSLYHRYNLEKYGGVNLHVQFPFKEEGIEALIVSWPYTGEDVIVIQYLKGSKLRFGAFHMNRIYWSRPFIINDSQSHNITIQLGSLFPQPSAYLLKRGYNPDQKNKLEISLNGVVLLSKTLEFQEGHPKNVYAGEGNFRTRLAIPWFSGKFISFERLPFLK